MFRIKDKGMLQYGKLWSCFAKHMLFKCSMAHQKQNKNPALNEGKPCLYIRNKMRRTIHIPIHSVFSFPLATIEDYQHFSIA